MKNIIIYSFFSLFLFSLTSCETEFTNPSASTEADVINSADGLELLTRGLHRRWSVGRQSPVYTTITAAGFTTGELRLINPGNISENELSIGGNTVDGSNSIVSNIWEQCLITRKEARTVLENINVIQSGDLRDGVRSYASLFAGMANGTLATFFAEVPLESTENATFSSREDALRAAINDLDDAIAAANNYKQFNMDVKNTAYALKARYSLMLGDNETAASTAALVDLSSGSTFTYDDVNTNPIAFVSIITNNVFQPKDLTLGLPEGLRPDESDERLAFYFDNVTPENSDFRASAFFDEVVDRIPVYVPGEMLLIQAEAAARENNIGTAIDFLDEVLTKQAEDDVFQIGANQAAYSGAETQDAVLEAIYTNRATEMLMSGQRLEDNRRFNRPGSERNRNFYPYPNSERDNNPNTPADPN